MEINKPYPTRTFQKLNYFALLLFVFWLPLKVNYLPLIISLWIFTWLLEGNLKEKFKSFKYDQIYFAFTVYFLLGISALLYTQNIDAGLFHIQKQLSIVFFPIIIAGSNKIVKKNYKHLLLVFVLANLIAAVYVLANAFFSNLIIENGNWYIKYWQWDMHKDIPFWQLVNMRYNSFSGLYFSLFMHPSYFSMYILFSLIILIDFLRKKQIKKVIYKIITIITIIFL